MKKYLDLITNISYIFILNLLLIIFLFKNITFLNIIFYLLEAILFGSLLTLICNICKNNKINKLLNIILLSFITVLFTAGFVHYKFYDCFFTFYSLINGGQVFGFASAIIKIIKENIGYFLVFVFVLISIFVYFPLFKKKKDKKVNIVSGINIFASIILILLLGVSFTKGIYSPHNLLFKTHNHTNNIRTFGYLTGNVIDMKRYILGFSPSLINENEKNKNYSKDYYNITDTDFEKLKKENKELSDFYNYIETKVPSNKNDYTGIFKDKNLIFITAESFSFEIIDKNTTPTLYKLKEEGLFFDNFYTPIYYASTSDGEYTNLTGNLPEEGTWSYIKSKNNYFPYSYANAFKSLGYKSFSYHNGVYNFYERNIVQKKFGFDSFKACYNGLEKDINCKLFPESDLEMFNSTYKDYKNEDKFISYYMSISSHLPHDFKNNDMAKKYKKDVKNLNYSKNVKAYISATKDFDKALESLINNLEKDQKLDDTVIVIVPDHFPYGLNRKEISEFKKLEKDYDLHKSGLIIYNSKLKGKKINKLSSNIDVLPTLLNMFGAEYDSRFIIGQDIMSNTNPIVIFNDQSFLINDGYYNSKKDSFYGKINKSALRKKQIEVYNKFNASRIILDNNVFEKETK